MSIRDRRRALGLTQTDLGKRVGINQPVLSLIEHGYQPPPAERAALACALEVLEADLFKAA